MQCFPAVSPLASSSRGGARGRSTRRTRTSRRPAPASASRLFHIGMCPIQAADTSSEVNKNGVLYSLLEVVDFGPFPSRHWTYLFRSSWLISFTRWYVVKKLTLSGCHHGTWNSKAALPWTAAVCSVPASERWHCVSALNSIIEAGECWPQIPDWPPPPAHGQCGVGGGDRGFLSPHGALELETKVREVWSFTITEHAPTKAFSWLKALELSHLREY